MENNLEQRAAEFAIAAHELIGQKRKYTGEPYWKHPEAVAEYVRHAGGTPEMIAAAWLHDTLEDTNATREEIEAAFGTRVLMLVLSLTDVSHPMMGNREQRKAIDRLHTAMTCPQAKTIKLADLLDNTRSICEHDPEFARAYLAEKRLLLAVLKEGDASLYQAAEASLRLNEEILGI